VKMNEIIIRKMTEADIDGVYDVEINSFAIPWSKKSFSDELSNSLAIYYIAESEGRVAGYAGMWNVADEGDVTNIAVHPDFRRRGIGKLLMKALFKEAQSSDMRLITLEVRESNAPARKMYESFGFKEVGIRKNYYADNRENAVIMTVYIEDKM